MVKRRTERKKKKMKMKKKVIKKKIKTTKKNVDDKKRTKKKTQHKRDKNRKGTTSSTVSVLDLKEDGYNIFDIQVEEKNYSLVNEPVPFFMYNNTAREKHLLKTHAVTGDKGKFKEFENQTLCKYLYINLPHQRIHGENDVFVQEIGLDNKITETLEDITRIFIIAREYIKKSEKFVNDDYINIYQLLNQFRADNSIPNTPINNVR